MAAGARALRAPGPPPGRGSMARTNVRHPRRRRDRRRPGHRPRDSGRAALGPRPRASRCPGVRGRRGARQARHRLLGGGGLGGDLTAWSSVGGRLDVLGGWPFDRRGLERRRARGEGEGACGGEEKSGRRAHAPRLLGGGRRAQAVRPARVTGPRWASVDPRAEDAPWVPYPSRPRACVSWLLGPGRRRRGWASSGSRRAPP